MYLIILLLMLAAQRRSYYVAPSYAVLVAAGTVWIGSLLHTHKPPRARLGGLSEVSIAGPNVRASRSRAVR